MNISLEFVCYSSPLFQKDYKNRLSQCHHPPQDHSLKQMSIQKIYDTPLKQTVPPARAGFVRFICETGKIST